MSRLTLVQDESDMVRLQVQIMEERKQQRADNVAEVLFAPERSRGVEGDVLAALESKYDALRDKLIIEALIAQVSGSPHITTLRTIFCSYISLGMTKGYLECKVSTEDSAGELWAGAYDWPVATGTVWWV